MKELLLAAQRNDLTAVKKLLGQASTGTELGKLLEETGMHGCTALYYAAKAGAYEVAYYLLKRGANPNHMTDQNWSALHAACSIHHVMMVRLLLSYQATDLDAHQNPSQFTPLHVVVAQASAYANERKQQDIREVLEILLALHAKTDIKDSKNRTPQEFAKEKGFKHITEILRFNSSLQADRAQTLAMFSDPMMGLLLWSNARQVFEKEEEGIQKVQREKIPCPKGYLPYAWGSVLDPLREQEPNAKPVVAINFEKNDLNITNPNICLYYRK
jgi:hypothetical protein